MKSSMALGKLFLTTLIASCLASPVRAGGPAMSDSVSGPFTPGDNWVSFLSNLVNYQWGLLDRNDKKIYQQSLYIMLENMPVGQVMEWYSDTNSDVYGRMRVVYGYQTSNGYCRVYQSIIHKNGNAREFQEYACRSEDNPRWQFYNK